MSLARSLTIALSRSIDQAKLSLASALRFEVTAPTTSTDAKIPLFSLASMEDVKAMATGCDSDIGGLSSVKVDLDPKEGKGRFWGTLSSEIPRSSKIQRSGYAGFRNKNRPTLFGVQTWDLTMHPYLILRVKNRLAKVVHDASKPSSLRSAISSNSNSLSAHQKAVHALGLDSPFQKAGPKFFVNVQTDGPVTSDLFQHRLTLDESKGDAWQDVIIPLSDFVLLNTGQVSPSQISMMRERIRTIGISVMLEHPASIVASAEKMKEASINTPPEALRSRDFVEDERVEDKNLTTIEEQEERERTISIATKRRGTSYNYDLGIESLSAISEEAVSGGNIEV